ncbi:hypothetical protein QOZ80_5AG0400930 [Eleusine coracana subsp. coracana]|nr:hypothetical protein QOZ80_5AG0400930 [Eleusine coracana subsp. coracana]
MAIPDEDDSFCPSNGRLVDRYLRAKLDDRLSDLGAKAAYFVDADVCSARPEELVCRHGMPASVESRDAADCKQWYFFSPMCLLGISLKKKSRTIAGTGDNESWHVEGSPKPIEGNAGSGYLTKFSYHKSPRGPGQSSKRKAAEDIEVPNMRPCMTDEDQNEDDAVFAGDLEHSLLSVEQHTAAAAEFGEAQNVSGTMSFDDLQKLMMIDVEDKGTTLQVPDGEDPEAFYMGVLFGDKEHAAIQTVRGPLTDGDVIAALASGVTLGELLPYGPSSPRPAGALGVPCT